MKPIALSILSVGLCFYIAYNQNINREFDLVASCIAFISALMVLFD